MPTGSKKVLVTVADDPWMNVQEAARALGMSRYKVLQFAMANGIESKQVAGRTVISRSAIEQHAEQLQAAR